MLRLKQHQRAVHNADVNTSAIAKHVWQEQHQMDRSSAEVVASEQYLCPRLLLESWQIHGEQHLQWQLHGGAMVPHPKFLTNPSGS